MSIYILNAFYNYSNFNGRATRKEYWSVFFVNLFVSFSLLIFTTQTVYWFSLLIYTLLIFLPFLSLTIRRLHDVGKNGFYVLAPLYNLFLLITKGDEGENKYGFNNLESKTDTVFNNETLAELIYKKILINIIIVNLIFYLCLILNRFFLVKYFNLDLYISIISGLNTFVSFIVLYFMYEVIIEFSNNKNIKYLFKLLLIDIVLLKVVFFLKEYQILKIEIVDLIILFYFEYIDIVFYIFKLCLFLYILKVSFSNFSKELKLIVIINLVSVSLIVFHSIFYTLAGDF